MKFEKFPKYIEIQTCSFCNGQCIICPHRTVSKKLPQGIMNDKLFEKILDYVGNKKIGVIPYLNSEPFLDPKFIERLKLIMKKCRNAKIEISTNMSLLSLIKMKELEKANVKIDDFRCSVFGFTKKTHIIMMPGLDWSIVKTNLNNLVKNKRLRKNIKEIKLVIINFQEVTKEDIKLAEDYCKQNKLIFCLWGFMDRCSNVHNYSNNIYHQNTRGCEQKRSLERMHITFDGKVILCCNDWRRQYIIGDITKESIGNIWISPKYIELRERINNPQLEAPKICKRCVLAK